MLKHIRLFLAPLGLLGFAVLFCDQSEGSIYATSLAWLGKIQLVPALLAGSLGILGAIVAVTFAYGRVYCSTVCPLGLLQDLLISLRKKSVFRYRKDCTWLRYGLLVLFALSLLVGIPLVVELLEPYSTFGRMASSLGQPVAVLINNAVDWLAGSGEGLSVMPRTLVLHSAIVMGAAVFTLGLLLWCTAKYGRIWCTHVCPVGAALGLVSRYALFRPRIAKDRCSHCGKCERICKANCIDSRDGIVDVSRCVACYNCQGICPSGALTFMKDTAQQPADSSRRHSLGKIAAAALAAFTAPSLASAASKRSEAEILALTYKEQRLHTLPLLPAGAINVDRFTARCTACQLCVAACPSHVLEAFAHGAGLLQPSLHFEHGYCKPECTVCGSVCPTHALTPITPQEKTAIQIGRARVDYQHCVVTTDKVTCTACQRHCPTGAISLVGEGTCKVPAVDTEKCIGCGACEFYCPARPAAAITVEGNRVQRRI